MSKLLDIKFTVENPPHLRHVDQNVTVKHKGGLEMVHFATGWGPCGRWVETLEHRIDTATLRIKQTSYPIDMTERAQKYRELINEVLKWSSLTRTWIGRHQIRAQQEFRKAEEALRAHTALATDTAKIEHFVYQLEDIRGRIKATEDTSGQKPTQ